AFLQPARLCTRPSRTWPQPGPERVVVLASSDCIRAAVLRAAIGPPRSACTHLTPFHGSLSSVRHALGRVQGSFLVSVRKLIQSWPVVRQLQGDRLGLGPAAQSPRSASLRPRTENAEPVVQ